MIDLLLALVVAILLGAALLFLLWSLVFVFTGIAGVELLNLAAQRLGLSRASPEGRTTGQRHPAEVTAPFEWDASQQKAVGTVRVRGEIWAAECDPPLADTLGIGQRVEILYLADELRVRVVGTPSTRR